MTEPVSTTMITAAGTGESVDRHTCPGVHTMPGRRERFVITRDVVDPEVHRALAAHMGDGEHLGAAPAWVPSLLMDLAALDEFIDATYRAAGDQLFRMECLPLYTVDSDGDDYGRWVAGATEPSRAGHPSWQNRLAADRAAGMRQRRVRRFGATLTDYERYACEWGYAINGPAGEEIRVLRDGEHEVPERLIDCEYWIVNDEHVVPVLYDGRGRWLGAGLLEPGRREEFRRDRDRAWAAAEPFDAWWSRHPELRRDGDPVGRSG